MVTTAFLGESIYLEGIKPLLSMLWGKTTIPQSQGTTALLQPPSVSSPSTAFLMRVTLRCGLGEAWNGDLNTEHQVFQRSPVKRPWE